MTAVRVMVMGAMRNVGTSVTAAMIADTLSVAGLSTTLVVVAPPYAAPDLVATSGLTDAPMLESSHPEVGFRVGQRASGAAVVGLTSSNPTMTRRPGFFSRADVPPVKEWLAVCGDPQMLVVDVGWDVLDGIGVPDEPVCSWLTDPDAAVYPVVVAPATRPGMLALGDVLAAVSVVREDKAAVSAGLNGVGASLIVVPRTRPETRAVFTDLLPLAGPEAMGLVEQLRRVEFVPESAEVLTSGVPDRVDVHMHDAARDILYASGAVTPPAGS